MTRPEPCLLSTILRRNRRKRVTAAIRGIEWLAGLQNADGGIPTFCRGWGKLPFDRSSPELTAHALLAWSAWFGDLPELLRNRIRAASQRAVAYLKKSQQPGGEWIPLWFGNQFAANDRNPVYGTSRVLIALGANPARAGSSRYCARRS